MKKMIFYILLVFSIIILISIVLYGPISGKTFDKMSLKEFIIFKTLLLSSIILYGVSYWKICFFTQPQNNNLIKQNNINLHETTKYTSINKFELLDIS